MATNRFHSCYWLFFAAFAALAWLQPTQLACATEPEYATVALLLGPGDLSDPICVVFDGADTPAINYMVMESSPFLGGFSGADLYPTDAQFVARGGTGRRIMVRSVNSVAPNHGVMLLGPNSDSEVLLQTSVYLDGSVVRYEPVPEFAEYLLVIVRGRVR